MDTFISEAVAPSDSRPAALELSFALHRIPEVLRKARGYLTDQFDAAAIARRRDARLARLLHHALDAVPAFRGLGPRLDIDRAAIDADPLAALARFPVMEKADLQTRLVDHVADTLDPDQGFKVTTSGSTGVPLTLVDDVDSLVEYAAVYYRVLDEYDIRPGDLLAHVIADGARPSHRIEAQLMVGLCDVGSPNLLGPDSRPRQAGLDWLLSARPAAVFGNPSDLALLAAMLAERGAALPGLRVALSCGENLTDGMRREVGRVLDCPVAEIYSMQECKAIAWQCRHGGVHLNDDRVVVEQRPLDGERTELLLTHLCNLSMPLIRYRTHDLGRIAAGGRCGCGRALSRLASFEGRDRGFLVTPDGRYFSPRAIKLEMTDLPVRAWDLRQDDASGLDLRFAPRDPQSAPELTAAIADRLAGLLGGGLDLRIAPVAMADLLPDRGKFQMMKLEAYKRTGGFIT